MSPTTLTETPIAIFFRLLLPWCELDDPVVVVVVVVVDASVTCTTDEEPT